MSKITVKHFIEKRVKPVFITVDETEIPLFPVYYKIIYRKLTVIRRSRTMILISEESFTQYQKTGKFIEDETDLEFTSGYDLKTEKQDIRNAVKIIDEYKIEVTRISLSNAIDKLIQPANNILINMLNFENDIDSIVKDTEYGNFVTSFRQGINLLEALNNIYAYTKIDLVKFVEPNDLIKWQSLKMLKGYEYTSFATFYFSDFRHKIKGVMENDTVRNYELSIQAINELLAKYISQVFEKERFK